MPLLYIWALFIRLDTSSRLDTFLPGWTLFSLAGHFFNLTWTLFLLPGHFFLQVITFHPAWRLFLTSPGHLSCRLDACLPGWTLCTLPGHFFTWLNTFLPGWTLFYLAEHFFTLLNTFFLSGHFSSCLDTFLPAWTK